MRSGIYDALFGSQSVNVGEMKEASSHTNVKTISMTLNRQASPDDIVINAMIKKIDNKEHLVFTSTPKNFYGIIMRCFFGNKKNVERFHKRGIEMTPVQTTSDDNDFNRKTNNHANNNNDDNDDNDVNDFCTNTANYINDDDVSKSYYVKCNYWNI